VARGYFDQPFFISFLVDFAALKATSNLEPRFSFYGMVCVWGNHLKKSVKVLMN